VRGLVESIRETGATVAIQTLHSLGETLNIVPQSPEILSKGLKSRATDQRTVIMNQPLEGCGSCTIHQIAATRCGGTHSFAHPMRCQIPNDARQVFLHIPTQLTRKPRNRSGERRIALLEAWIDLPAGLGDEQRQLLIRAGESCPVKVSLEGCVPMRLHWTPATAD
jgi:hypothetical protein